MEAGLAVLSLIIVGVIVLHLLAPETPVRSETEYEAEIWTLKQVIAADVARERTNASAAEILVAVILVVILALLIILILKGAVVAMA